MTRTLAPARLAALLTCALPGAAAAEGEVAVYTTREPGLFAPLAAAFTEKTGIRVRTVFVKDGLAERVRTEGEASPADLLMTVDIGNLVDLVDAGVTRPIASPEIAAAVPAHLRSPDGAWTALSLRARLIWADPALKLSGLTYQDLADPKWKGQICIRSGQHPYNTALIAAMIAHDGEAKTEAWVKGVKANLARRPGGGDRDVARDILGGICRIGLGNSYYVGLMRSGKGGPAQKTWGDGVDVILPSFRDGGTHVNVSGAAIARHAPHADAAEKLLAFLVSPEGQKIYAEQNFEYPVRRDAAVAPVIADLGALEVDALPLGDIARRRAAASLVVDRVGFDQ